MLQLTDSGSRDTTSEVKYALCACSYLGAMVASNAALQYVNYPTQVLGKSCKPIPVMLLGKELMTFVLICLCTSGMLELSVAQ